MTPDVFTFGVEFECYLPVGGDRHALARAISDAGVACSVAAYGHVVTSHWRIVTDGSLGDYSRGIELVSPVLRGDAGLAQVATVCRMLAQFRCTVSDKCGLHVHVGVGPQQIGYFKKLVRLYQSYEPIIDKMMPTNRRGSVNAYCRTLASVRAASIEAAYSVADLADAIKRATGASKARYHKLNIVAHNTYKTVEFRQHSGTINYTKARTWILTCLRIAIAASRELPIANTAPAIVNRAKRGSKAWQIGEMLLSANGVSRTEVCRAFNWPSVSIPQKAAACKLDIYSQRTGREVRYYVRRAAMQTSMALDISLAGLCNLIGSTPDEADYMRTRTTLLNPAPTRPAIQPETHAF